jgi:3-oxoacyl-[acyl-carrier protein] reductase
MCCALIWTDWQRFKRRIFKEIPSKKLIPSSKLNPFRSQSHQFDGYRNVERMTFVPGDIAMSKLKNKVAVVTGASKGIGAGIAKGLAAEGASVVVNYSTSREGAERVVAEIKGQGGKAIAVKGDVGIADDVKKIFAETQKAFGRLDVLVNNAGIYKFTPLEDVSEKEFNRQFNTNVLGVLLATQEAARHFGPEGGSVINIGSAVTTLNPPTSSVYTATKGAVNSVTKVLSKELGPKKIRVNAINPGMVETEGTHTAGFIGTDFQKSLEQQTPLGRIGQTDDITPIAVFLASNDSEWLTGELISASGGL